MKRKNIQAKLFNTLFCITVLLQSANGQDCKTNEAIDEVPGKYLTAAEYPWPAARAEYFNKMTTAADKAAAKQTLGQIEKTEQQSHNNFNLTGGNWESVYSTEGYGYAGNTKLGQYTFQSALYEFFCAKGKLVKNSEYNSVLRISINGLPVNTLSRFIEMPFGSSMGSYDLGFQYMDWKNHKPADVQAQLIPLFTYMTCNNQQLLDAINSGNNYFQDVAEKNIRPNNRSNYIYRYWFVKKNSMPILVAVSRKEYLQSLLEYYEREKLYFPRLIAKLTADHDKGVAQYSNWEADVADKIAIVTKTLTDSKEEWLAAPAVINHSEDASQVYKNKLAEKTNYNRFWRFYDNEKKGNNLYKYNPAYFKTSAQGAARPQMISIAFRYVTISSSLRILDNFTKNFDFEALKKLLE